MLTLRLLKLANVPPRQKIEALYVKDAKKKGCQVVEGGVSSARVEFATPSLRAQFLLLKQPVSNWKMLKIKINRSNTSTWTITYRQPHSSANTCSGTQTHDMMNIKLQSETLKKHLSLDLWPPVAEGGRSPAKYLNDNFPSNPLDKFEENRNKCLALG